MSKFRLVFALIFALAAPAWAQQGSAQGPIVPSGPWTSYSPVISCAAGTIGGYSRQYGYYQQYGKSVLLMIDVQAAIGTCSGDISISLPVTAASLTARQALSGGDIFSGTSWWCVIPSGGNACNFESAVTVSDNFIFSGSMQSN